MAAKPRVDEILRLANDAEKRRLRDELAGLKKQYSAALAEIEKQKASVQTLVKLSGVKPKRISVRRASKGRPPATAILLCSDWHVEELVKPETCRGLNSFDLGVADHRIAELAKRATRLIEHERGLADVQRIVVCAMGDFISNHIHEDTAELAQLAPLAATRWAGERLSGVIGAMAQVAPVLVATCTGNHGRSTMKPRIATENEHSYEQHLYLTLAAQESRPNVSWQVGAGYHNLVDLDGFLLRVHHGHALSYGGGVGGLTIPVLKAITSWNHAQKADLDVFGHWHQHLYIPRRFVANASLIGHNAYADRIKAEFQPPSQTLIILDHSHNRITKVLQVFLT